GEGEAGVGGGGEGGGGGGANPNNQRPILERVGDREAVVGEQLEIQLRAADPDQDPLRFKIRSEMPEGAKFDKVEGLFRWTPVAAEANTQRLITFEVSDGDLKDQETIVISVVAAGTGGNRPPVFEDIGDQAITAGEPFTLQLIATDPNGDALTYAMNDAPPGAGLDPQTGRFTWTPDMSAAGQRFEITFTVADAELSDEMVLALVVRDQGQIDPGNLPPQIDPIDDQVARVGEEIRVVVRATDDHPESLVYNVVGPLPTGARFDSPTATFTWTPTADQANQAYAVIFQVSDGEFRQVQRVSFQVEGVEEPIEPPSCEIDAYEANEPSPITADAPIEATLCPAGNIDRFSLEIPANQEITVTLDFRSDDPEADVDIALYKADNTLIAESDGTETHEQFTAQILEAGRYQIEVFDLGATSTYTLRYSLSPIPVVPTCEPDVLEPNQSPEAASDLWSALEMPLNICTDDEDFFRTEWSAGTQVSLAVRFRHDDGDLDAVLTGPEGFTQNQASSDDDEVFELEVAISGVYTLKVFGYDHSQNNYTLTLDEVAPPACEPDRVEPNDSLSRAEPFRPELYRGMTYCGDDDWYKTEVAVGQTMMLYISYDGPAPQVVAYAPTGEDIDQSYEVPDPSECQASREACRLLRVEGLGDWIHYRVRGRVGQGYDLDVEMLEPSPAP
ncbi:hypothetical protein KKF91_20710, partial [Myxococcota bacterium]|nr:hypothetical protein [Myxococcota bacterium]